MLRIVALSIDMLNASMTIVIVMGLVTLVLPTGEYSLGAAL